MSSELEMWAQWSCPGDELSPGIIAELKFINKTHEFYRVFTILELTMVPRGVIVLSMYKHSTSAIESMGEKVNGNEADILRMIDRSLAFLLRETSKQFFTRRRLLQKLGHKTVGVVNEENNWVITKTEWREDL